MRGVVLVVDDHARPRRALALELEDAGYTVLQAEDGARAWQAFRQHRPDVVVSDLVMPNEDGIELLSRIRGASDVPVILFTARGSLQSVASAFKAGADEFVASSDAGADDLVALVENALLRSRRPPVNPDLEQRIVGSSLVMQRVRERLAALAPLRTPVLVSGEAGTGRDAAIYALHELGATAREEFKRIDCAEFEPGERLPSTGAVYLDGVELLTPEAQDYWSARLARSQSKNITDPVRVLASTSEPLYPRARGGSFNDAFADVLLRFVVELPPLRDRDDDVKEIADAMVARIGGTVGRRLNLSPSAKSYLASCRWRNNVRDLERVLERAVAFSRSGTIRKKLIEEIVCDHEPSVATVREQRTHREREELLQAIHDTGGNISRAAEALGKSRGAVYRLIEKHGIALRKRGI